jgi:hypothetical protein
MDPQRGRFLDSTIKSISGFNRSHRVKRVKISLLIFALQKEGTNRNERSRTIKIMHHAKNLRVSILALESFAQKLHNC